MAFSTKIFLSNILVMYLFSMGHIGSEIITSKSTIADESKGNCTCGGFGSEELQADSVPLMSQSPGLLVKCDEEGGATCKKLCVALATAAKAKGPEILCIRLITANELMLSAFYKSCDTPWTFAGMTAEEPLCCENSTLKLCPNAVLKTNDTTTNATKKI